MPHSRSACRSPARLPAPRPRGRGRAGARDRHAWRAEACRRASQHFPYVNPAAPKGGRLVLGALGTFDSLNPFIIKGVTPGNLREYVYESLMTRSGDEPFTLYGLIAESVELPEDRSSITFHLRDAGPLLRRRADHARGRALQSRNPEGEGLALSPLALRQGGEGGEDRPAQRALHLRGGRRPRDPAHPRAHADPAAPQDRRRDLRAHHAGAAGRQRTLRRRPRRCRPLPHLSPQPRLVGARPPGRARALQFRRDPRRVLPRCRLPVRGLQGRRDRRAARGRSRPLDRGLRLPGRRRTGASSSASSTRACPRACRRSSSTRAGPCSRTPACAAPSSCCSTPNGSTAACSTAPTSARRASSSARSSPRTAGQPMRASARCSPPSRNT